MNMCYYMMYCMSGLNIVVIRSKPDQFLFCSALTADPNTLFRSNSLASKAMEQFMKVRWCILFYFITI